MIHFYIGRISVKIHYSFLLLVSLFLLVEQEKTGVLFFSAVLLHEAGHLLAMRLCSVPIRSITLTAFGVAIERSERAVALLGEAFIYLMGPLVNGISFLFLLPWGRILWCRWAASFHLILALVNLLPIPPLDGGNLLSLFLCDLSCQKGDRWMHRIVAAAIFLLFLCGIWVWNTQNSPAVLLFAVLLLFQHPQK